MNLQLPGAVICILGVWGAAILIALQLGLGWLGIKFVDWLLCEKDY